MPIIKLTPPITQPITLVEARMQCQIDSDITDEDTLIESLLGAATDFCERYTGKPAISQTKQYVGPLCEKTELSPNLLSVETVSYIDSFGVQQDLDTTQFYVDTASIVGQVYLLVPLVSVSTTHPQPASISFTCGYGSADDVPDSFKQCIRLLVGHWFRNRETVGGVTGSIAEPVASLLNQHRLVKM